MKMFVCYIFSLHMAIKASQVIYHRNVLFIIIPESRNVGVENKDFGPISEIKLKYFSKNIFAKC